MSDEITGSGESTDTSDSGVSTSVPETHTGGSGALGSTGDDEARRWQARYDREKAADTARIQRLESELTASRGGGITLDQVRAAASEASFAAEELRTTRDYLREQYPDVARFAPGLFKDVQRHRNPETLRVAVESEASRLEAELGPWRTEKEEEIKAAFAKTYGRSLPPSAGAEGTTDSTGLPTIAEINSFSPKEWDEYEAAHPGVINRVIDAAGAEEVNA